MKTLQVSFQKSHKLLAANLHERRSIDSELSIAIYSTSKAGYVTTGLAIVSTELCAQEASSFFYF